MRPYQAAGLLLLLSVPPVYAQERAPIGETLTVINVVTAEFNRDTRTLQAGDDVRQNELIDVSKDASTELKLNDDTKLALGPGAKLMLDKFIYDPDKAAGAIGLDLVEGAFRFITGVAQKPSYVIKVPRASITVRGTLFDVFVQPDDTTFVLLHEGAVKVCNERGDCRELDDPGKVVRVASNGDVDDPAHWARLNRDDGMSFDDAFPFVVTPPTIDPTPVFTRDALIRLGAIERDAKPTRSETPKKKASQPQPKKKSTRVEPKPTKKATPAKKTAPPKKTAQPKKPPPTRKAGNDEAVKKAIGAAVGIGIGIGIGKMIGGGKKKGGGSHDGGGGRKPPPGHGYKPQ